MTYAKEKGAEIAATKRQIITIRDRMKCVFHEDRLTDDRIVKTDKESRPNKERPAVRPSKR